LAKAQGQLVNPEKSIVATIRGDGPRGTQQTFRYAPLSSGLDIVRKILGQHEIATVQTTSIDQAAGIINLTTVLAHASGEWIASDWPVCAVSETSTPHRMGAALTYARRYALFTLVGIAGEDDLDAPDLITPANETPNPERPNGHGNGQQQKSPFDGRRSSNAHAQAMPALGVEPSAQLRDRLLAGLSELGSSADAAKWAHGNLSEKNQLTTSDARAVEDAFEVKLQAFGDRSASEPTEGAQSGLTQVKPRDAKSRKRPAIDKRALAISEPRRVRDRDHVKFVAQHPCLICGRFPSDAHHMRFKQNRALGRKVSDEFTVPLCRGHHREVHRCGDEAAWWRNAGVDPTVAARSMWLESHPLKMWKEKSVPSTDPELEPKLPAPQRL
jgi:hypothetical protein